MTKPLATILRPDDFNDFFGQEKIVAKDSWLRIALKNEKISSIIFWGPPGSGKTTLALIIAKESKAVFKSLSATDSGLKDLREIVLEAETNRRLGQTTILFIDEIHRWNKAQQDALLPAVESGLLVLIGATTENPSFSINSALLSRLKVLVLESLSELDLIKIIKRALKKLNLKVEIKSVKAIARLSASDARRALNIIDDLVNSGADFSIDNIKKVVDKPSLNYDKAGDEHYHLISALHKSMRGSDAKASLYWLVRMLESGEDPLFIARRLIRFASEDIGLANNSALLIANSAHDACLKIGMPECNLALAQAVIYLAKSKKSVMVYSSYNQTLEEINASASLSVPLHLRNAPTNLMKNLNYGKDYKYSPEEDDSGQEYLPKGLKNNKFKNFKL